MTNTVSLLMPPTPSIAAFNQWLLAEKPDTTAACAIVLHASSDALDGELHQSIASYLNEYDEAADGRWLAVEGNLVQTIASDARIRRLLNIPEPAATDPAITPCSMKNTLRALAQRGHVVLDTPLASAATHNLPNTFHVAVGFPADGLSDCHMILNPDRFQHRCLPQIIGDTFLEWLNCRMRPERLRST